MVLEGNCLYVIWKKYLSHGASLMTRLENGLERKKTVYFSPQEDVEVLQRD